jgi:N-acetylneuraminic acid mutarotase
VAAQGGDVYSFGGITNNVAIANAYKYSPSTNTWTPIAPLPAPRGWFSATTDGTYIYLLGGVDENFATTATLWRYDPINNTYNTTLPPYTIPTYFHATAFLNGKIYRIAGRGTGTDFHVEVYDIALNTWSMAANYPFANHSLMAVALGSYVYAGGGNASPNKTWRYDPMTNAWDDAAVADLPVGRSAAASGAYNGKWLLAGGDVNFANSNSVIAWDPSSNSWSDLTTLIQARDYLAGTTAGQSFYAVAGNSAPGTPTNDTQRYTEPPCISPTPVSISGTIWSCSNPNPTPVPGVTLTLTGSESGSTVSNAAGTYSLTVSSGGSYSVMPAKMDRAPGSIGINTVDIIAIQRHFLNVALLTGCRLTAGDVNGDSMINTVDVIATQRFFLGLSTGTANVGKYQFNPESRKYLNVVTDQSGQDYDALIFGDVAAQFVQP